jgi:hypothetical protein
LTVAVVLPVARRAVLNISANALTVSSGGSET